MPLVQNPSLGGGQVALLSTTTVLTPAQILAMLATGQQVVPAPGAGKIIVPMSMVFVLQFGIHAYSTGGQPDKLSPSYGQNGDAPVLANIDGLVTSATNLVAFAPGELFQPAGPIADDVNQPITVFGSNYNFGPIVTATLGAGGLGYAANDTGTITNGANDATYKVLTVGAGGAVLTFQITGAGTACTVANGNATVDGGAQPGVGVGFTVNITAVQTGDGTLKVVTYYQIIPVP